MKYFLALSFILLSTQSSFAKKENTKSVMQDAFYSLTQLIPLMSSGMKFSDPSQEKNINNHIARMLVAFKKGSHQKMLNSPGLKPNVEALVNNLEAAQISFNDHNKAFARMRLNASTSLCISCHTQLPKDQVMSMLTSNKKLERKLDGNHYELGNLYFILRNYEKALQNYTDYIKEVSEKKSHKSDTPEFFNKYLYNSYFNVVYITAKVLKSPKRTISLLNSLSKDVRLPSYVQSDILIWKNRAKFWAKKYPKIEKKTFSKKEITKLIQNLESMMIIENSVILSSDYDYDLMVLSGILSNALVTNTGVDKGVALYWLGLTEYRLAKSIFYNIGDQYLKQCILNNKKKAIASKCFQAYESEVILRNTGTGGTHIPKTVKAELKRLKRLL